MSAMRLAGTRMPQVCATAVVLVAAQAGFAAEKTPTPDSDALQLEEVVVTAQKRAETIQSVPMSITAISEHELEGAMTFQDVASSVPSLAFRSSGPGRQQ